MRISTKSQYGLRAMVYLSEANKVSPLKIISEKENIPHDYLEKIMIRLVNAGFIKAHRGSHGGYFLAKKPKKIIIGDIIKVLEGETSPVKCLSKDKYYCTRQRTCKTRKVWKRLKNSLNSALNSITLADISEKNGKLS